MCCTTLKIPRSVYSTVPVELVAKPKFMSLDIAGFEKIHHYQPFQGQMVKSVSMAIRPLSGDLKAEVHNAVHPEVRGYA